MDEDIFSFDSQYQELLNENIEDKDIPLATHDFHEPKLHIDLFSIHFNCKGESSYFDDNIFRPDLENLLNHHSIDIPDSQIELFDFDFDIDFSNYDMLIQMARANVQKLAMSLLDSIDQQTHKSFYSIRKDVTNLMLLLRENYQHLNESQLKILRTMFGTFDSMSNFSMVHLSYCNDGNASTSANYHLLHLMLECRWIYLTIIYKIDFFNGQIGSDDSELSCELKLLMFDLTMLTVSKFQKSNSANLVNTSPFICSCVKDVWKLLYNFMTKLCDQNLEFWHLLSTMIDEIAGGKSLYEKFRSKKTLLRNSHFMTFKNHELFAIWLSTGIFKLIDSDEAIGKKESYEFYENLIRKYLKIDQSEENMRVLLVTIADILLNVFQPKSEILMILWEFYQRKINSPFLIIGQNINSMAVSSLTAFGYLEQIKIQQNSPITKLNLNSSSYSMFVYVLGKMAQRFTDDGQKVQVQKIFSRIYTKFPPNKLQQLNEMGIHNFMRLLISLSVSVQLCDVGQKVTDTLLQIPMEKSNHQQQVMKGHLAMLILYHENRMNIGQYVTKILNQVNNIVQKTNSAANILRIFSESLSLILLKSLNENEEFLENGEELLLDSWIISYFQSTTPAEQDRLYESLTKIIIKVNELQSSSLVVSKVAVLKDKLFNILLPYVKQVFGKVESVWLPEMVANLCLLSKSSHSGTHKFEDLFKTFIDSNSSNLEQSMKFLSTIMKNSKNKESLDVLTLIQNWIKFSVLLNGNNNELKELTNQIVLLKEFNNLCETSVVKTEEFLNSKERLCSFISDIGRKYSSSNNQQKFQLIEKVHGYLQTFEKWSLPFLQQQHEQPSSQRTLSQVSVDESIMRIYSFIAITFLHCCELIYVRSKSSCFFNVAIAHFLLPSTLMVGQNPPRSIIVSMHRIWPLLIEGISRLNYKCDQHVGKVLNDVIVKWAPLMKISNNSKFVAKPFVSITNFKNVELIEMFWGKLAKSFVALQPGRKSNSHSMMMLTIFEEVLHVIENDESRLLTVWRNVMQQVIECAMLLDDIEPTQKTCLVLLERFMKNRNFEISAGMKELLLNNLRLLTESSLSYHSALYFRFLSKMAKINVSLIGSFQPHLLTHIQKVEQLRGSGRDVKLRNFYDQLQIHCRNVRM